MNWNWEKEYKDNLEQQLALKEFLKHEKKYAEDLENRDLFERIFNIKPKRKEWISVKMPYRFDDSEYLNKEKVNNIKGDGKMKITNWKQFKGLENGKGLYTEAYLLNDDINFCNFYVTDSKNRLMLGTYPTNDLSNLVETLKKYGFDIEYEKSFNLADFLRESLKPKEFEYGKINFYFTFDENNYITLLNAEDVKTLNCIYFSKKIDDISCVEATLESEKVTIGQLKFALKELGWWL